MDKFQKVAIVTDSLMQFGGADRVLLSLLKIFPEASIFTSFYKPAAYPEAIKTQKVHTFTTQKGLLTRLLSGFSRNLSFTFPYFFEQLDLSEYDLVISLSAGPAKGIITNVDTKHIGFIFTPPHFQFGKHRNLRGMRAGKLINNFITPITDQLLRIWDYNAAQRVDHVITNSKYIRQIVSDTYGRDSEIIHAPVDIERFQTIKNSESGSYFLIISRLFEFKRVDRAIKACNKLGKNLKIIGDGPDKKYLESIAGPRIEFLGEVPDKTVNQYLKNSSAVIFSGTDDFGIVSVEAQSAGKPLIAYHRGGVPETIKVGKTGILFKETDEQVKLPTLEEVLESFDHLKYSPKECVKNAQNYSEQAFISKMKSFLEKL